MNRCAVVIGVNQTGGLQPLQGAAKGAADFADWAQNQGMQVKLLTDQNGKPVTLKKIKSAVAGFVKQRIFGQLILFFSGHGILSASGSEVWLLSGAPVDPNEAVNVVGSVPLSRNVGIPHVVFISDACRSSPASYQLRQVQGGLVFPSFDPQTPRPSVDVFYATLAGNPAWEFPPDQVIPHHRGVFTQCLLKGLKGGVPNLIVPDLEGNFVVPGQKLKNYLEKEVPKTAAAAHQLYNQAPDITVESHDPLYLSKVGPPLGFTGVGASQPDLPAISSHLKQLLRYFTDPNFSLGNFAYQPAQNETPNQASQPDIDGFNQLVQLILAAKGRPKFETETGFTVVGASVQRAIVTRGIRSEVFPENGNDQIRVHDNGDFSQGKTALVQLDNGLGIPLAVLPGFIGTLTIDQGQVVSVDYVPSAQTNKYNAYQSVAKEIEERKAFVAAAALNGSFRFGGRHFASKGADFLKIHKSLDPILGLFAAYAYAQADDLDGIKSVYECMAPEKEPFLFDVVMLSSLLGKTARPKHHRKPVAPFCPMIAQGWAYLAVTKTKLPMGLQNARQFLVPALFTTFSAEGVEELWSAINKGDLV